MSDYQPPESYLCPRDNTVVMCPGPCPDGTPHVLLPPCETCAGRGLVNIRPNPEGGSWAEHCPACRGRGAVVPSGRNERR